MRYILWVANSWYAQKVKKYIPLCTAATATPEEYAKSVRNLIKERAPYDRDKFVKSARKVANAAQRKALKT